MAFSDVDKYLISSAYEEEDEAYARDRDWRALCDRYLEQRRNGVKDAGPNIVEQSHIERAIGEEFAGWSDEGSSLDEQAFAVMDVRQRLSDAGYDPDKVVFERLPAHVGKDFPSHGTVADLERDLREEEDAHADMLTALHADMYARREVIPFGAKLSVKGYTEYEKQKTQERINALRQSFAPPAGVDYSKPAANMPPKEAPKDPVRDKAHEDVQHTSGKRSRMVNSIENGVSGDPSYDFDEWVEEDDDDGDFGGGRR